MSTQAPNAGTGDIVALLLDDDIPASRLGAMLAAARKRRGMKRRRVAARVGISREELRAYERGTTPVPAAVCARLAECYGDDLTAHVPLHTPVQVEPRWIVAGNQVLANATGDADEVLRNYVDVLRRLRGAEPGEPVALRAADLSALASALGDDPHTVELKIVDLLGCSREEAAQLRSELLRRKVILPVAGLAAGAALFAAASAGAQSGSPPQPVAPAPTTVSQAEPDWNIVDEDLPREAIVEAAPSSTPPSTTPPATAAPAPVAQETEAAPEPPAPESVTDATVPDAEQPEDVPVSIPEGEVFVEIGDAITEP